MGKLKSYILPTLVSSFVYSSLALADSGSSSIERSPSSKESIELDREGVKIDIKGCGEKATAHFFRKSDTIAVIRIQGANSCTRYETSKENGKLGGTEENRGLDYEFPIYPGLTTRQVINIHSNSGKTSARIVAKVESDIKKMITPTVLNLNKKINLKSCGGSVAFKVSNKSEPAQYNLQISDMKSCDRFDIIESSGSSIAYTAKEIDSSNASFTLPQKVVTRGVSFSEPILDLLFGSSEPNLIKVKFYNSRYGSIQDIVFLYFYDNGNATEDNNNIITL